MSKIAHESHRIRGFEEDTLYLIVENDTIYRGVEAIDPVWNVNQVPPRRWSLMK